MLEYENDDEKLNIEVDYLLPLGLKMELVQLQNGAQLTREPN